MAKLNNLNKPLRILVYGRSKHRKTWWVSRAAEAGFNLLLVDGDDGAHILNKLSPEAQARVEVIDAGDSFDRPVMCMIVAAIMKGEKICWDEQKKRNVLTQSGVEPDNSYVVFDPRLLTPNTVLVFDSWTALVQSVNWDYAIANNVDMSDAEKPEWDGYAYSGRMASWVLTKMKALPCHVAVIAHSEIHETRNKEGKVVKERLQPVSVSRPHSQQLAKYFSDVLFFDYKGSQLYVYAEAGADKDGGSRALAPGKYKWEDLDWNFLCKEANIPTPDGSQELDWYSFSSGAELDLKALRNQTAPNKTLKSGAASTAKVSTGLALKNPLKKGL